MRELKLIWDFYGPRAQGTAEHHAAHVSEFVRREGVSGTTGAECAAPGHWSAWLIVSEAVALRFRTALKPNRAVLAEAS